MFQEFRVRFVELLSRPSIWLSAGEDPHNSPHPSKPAPSMFVAIQMFRVNELSATLEMRLCETASENTHSLIFPSSTTRIPRPLPPPSSSSLSPLQQTHCSQIPETHSKWFFWKPFSTSSSNRHSAPPNMGVNISKVASEVRLGQSLHSRLKSDLSAGKRVGICDANTG